MLDGSQHKLKLKWSRGPFYRRGVNLWRTSPTTGTKEKNSEAILFLFIYLGKNLNRLSEVINLEMSETLKAVSDPVRREILELLNDGRKTAGEIPNSFNLTGATVSYHLSNLKKANLITETKII